MKGSNRAVFAVLERHCEQREEPLLSAGAPRWVHGDRNAQEFLQKLEVGPAVKFGNHRVLAHLRFETSDYVALIGFDFEPDIPGLTLTDDNPGVVVCLLSETLVLPTASPAQIRDVVEAGRAGEDAYVGHDAGRIKSLFPNIQLFQTDAPIDEDLTWRTFLKLCASECEQGGSWIEQELSMELSALTDLNVPELPYREISRSMFDLDPRALFMALYRCVEATYAYESCRKLVEALGVSSAWQDLAMALEREIGWHPTEAASLNLILSHANERDLEDLCSSLNAKGAVDLPTRAGRAVYALRNRIVHYRLGMETVATEDYDWNRICICLIRVVYSIFARVHL